MAKHCHHKIPSRPLRLLLIWSTWFLSDVWILRLGQYNSGHACCRIITQPGQSLSTTSRLKANLCQFFANGTGSVLTYLVKQQTSGCWRHLLSFGLLSSSFLSNKRILTSETARHKTVSYLQRMEVSISSLIAASNAPHLLKNSLEDLFSHKNGWNTYVLPDPAC
jgi:hypothetical protein